MEEGTVTVDMTRDARRNLSVTFNDVDGTLGYGPDGFWYDKVIKPYYGLEFVNGDQWVTPLGQFVPDTIGRPAFPNQIKANCRDLTKKLLVDKFPDTTTYSSGTNVGTVISTIASAGGITDQTFDATSETLDEDVTFERNTERFKAMKELALAISHEVFFNSSGSLVFRPRVDPTTAPVAIDFQDGDTSNLVDWNRSTSDRFMFNDVIVHGSATENALVWAQAENTTITSPTRIAKIGRRTDFIPSQFIADNFLAQTLADSILSVSALEQFDMNFSAVMLPWLEVADAVNITTEDADPGDPTRFLLSNLSIPLALGAMTGTGRRVTNVG
jgi:hypothetical protein